VNSCLPTAFIPFVCHPHNLQNNLSISVFNLISYKWPTVFIDCCLNYYVHLLLSRSVCLPLKSMSRVIVKYAPTSTTTTIILCDYCHSCRHNQTLLPPHCAIFP
jgi:hypothetical protein